MTPYEKSRRSDALWHDCSGAISRRWLCDKVAQLESDIEGLEAALKRLKGGETTPESARAKECAGIDLSELDGDRCTLCIMECERCTSPTNPDYPCDRKTREWLLSLHRQDYRWDYDEKRKRWTRK